MRRQHRRELQLSSTTNSDDRNEGSAPRKAVKSAMDKADGCGESENGDDIRIR
nr:tail fiber protein [Escherichia coli]